MTYNGNNYREIITKAVCGTGRQLIHSTNHIISEQQPTSILGCWIINHKYQANKTDSELVEVRGTYDINIWYGYHDNTKTDVLTERVDYCDEVKLAAHDVHCLQDEDEVMVKVVQQPNCLECKIDQENERIAIEVEKEFIIKIIGETKVSVLVDPAQQNQASLSQANHSGAEIIKGNKK